MMPRRQIVIDFNVPDDPEIVSELGLIHRIRIFEDDLDREFWQNGQGVVNIGRIDLTRPRVSVTLSSNRHTGSALILIEKQLVRHKLAEIAAVSKVELASVASNRQKSK